jgi:hypothetical protein
LFEAHALQTYFHEQYQLVARSFNNCALQHERQGGAKLHQDADGESMCSLGSQALDGEGIVGKTAFPPWATGEAESPVSVEAVFGPVL